MRAEVGGFGTLDGVLLYGWSDLDFICHFVDTTLVRRGCVDGRWRTSFLLVVRLDGQSAAVSIRSDLHLVFICVFSSLSMGK
jgi:hypothetical protein